MDGKDIKLNKVIVTNFYFSQIYIKFCLFALLSLGKI